MSKSTQKISDERMLDVAARAASIAKKNGIVDKTQVSKLLSVLETVGDDRSCLLILSAYIYRQVNKREIDRDTSKVLSSFLIEMYNNNMSRRDARKFLGMFKWLFESIERARFSRPVNSYMEFVRTFFSR